jgi:N-methylhydantoinase A
MASIGKRKRSHVRIAVDIGGTFTDGIAHAVPGNRIWVAKRLTTPDDPGRAVSEVIQDLLAALRLEGRDARAVAEVVHGTTLVANTIIERKGAITGLLATQGTKDVLDIGREFRYDLYDLDLELPRPLVPPGLRAEVDERLDASGGVVVPLAEAALEAALGRLRKRRVESVAICLLHAYANPSHERRVAEAVRRRMPGVSISVSSEVAAEIREFERTSTTVANAYVQPLMARYLERLEGRLGAAGIAAPLRIMVSSGGFTSSAVAARLPILLLESGPAGGVLSALDTARRAGVRDLLALDMGGTTAKACVCVGGEAGIAHAFEAARVKRFIRGSGLPILIPSIDLIEIGAGGGSIAEVNRLGLLNVGPRSAGAVPGPACYGQGGAKPTVTDADLILGYLDADHFLGGEMRLDAALAERALGALARDLGLDLTATAFGIHDLVNENMAAAARVHVAEKGLDPRRLTLVATGGAGPVHAVEVARKLGMRRVLCTIAAGAGSVLALLAAPARVDRSMSKVELLADVDWAALARSFARMQAEAVAELGSAGARSARFMLGAEIRYAGQGNAVDIVVPYRAIDAGTERVVRSAFEKRYAELYGGLVPQARPEVVTWRLTGRSRSRASTFALVTERRSERRPRPIGRRRMFHPRLARYAEAPVYDRYSLAPGTKLAGPLVLEERESTLVVSSPARVRILADSTVLVELA